MSMISECTACGQNFRKFSMKSNENRCEECKGKQSQSRKNLYRQQETRREQDAASFISRLDNIELQLDAFNSTIDTAMDALRIDIKLAVVEQLEDGVLQDKVDSHMGKLKDNMATVNTSVENALQTIADFEKSVKPIKTFARRLRILESRSRKRPLLNEDACYEISDKMVKYVKLKCPDIWFPRSVLTDEGAPLHGLGNSQMQRIMRFIKEKKIFEHNGQRSQSSRYKYSSPDKEDLWTENLSEEEIKHLADKTTYRQKEEGEEINE